MQGTASSVAGNPESPVLASIKGRSFLKLEDFSAAEIQSLLDLATELKSAKRKGREARRLVNRNIALVFEKASTRTRSAFEVAAYDQGANITYIGGTGSHIGAKETMKDTARVLGRMHDGIGYRGHGQAGVEELAAYAGIPVWNGLTNEFHPTQSLADLMTIQEHSRKPLAQTICCYLGDAANNTCNSLLVGAAKMGVHIRLAAPKALWPDPALFERAQGLASASGAQLLLTEAVEDAVRGADFVYTDAWISMGEPAETWGAKIEALKPYQVTREVMAASGKPDTRFLHCLPAIHNRETELGARLAGEFGLANGVEVTEEVFESEASVVFDQAENRLHTIKAIMVATLGE